MNIGEKLGKGALNLEKSKRVTSNQALQTLQLIGEVFVLLLKVLWASGEALFRSFVPVPLKSIKGEVVLVTGAGHGIGRELALQYASHGATVVCWDINKNTNEETVGIIAKLGHVKAYGYVCNVANREQVLQVAEKVQREVGDVTILVNNAGVMPCHNFLDYSVEEIGQIMDINVMAHFWTLQAFLPTMLKNNHGHIVALSSCAGLGGLSNLVPYCASKFAVRGMMEALFQELRMDPKCQIKFTTFYPFGVDTGLCKRPVLRFPNITPMLNPVYVAKFIVRAQRRNVVETTIPSRLLTIGYTIRLLPIKAINLMLDFFDSYMEPDL